MRGIRHVLWDFNGTLLDDVDCCVRTLNTLLAERALPEVTRADYLARFGFPVRDYYLALGFDFGREDFATVSSTYIARYTQIVDCAAPHAQAHDVLADIAARGVAQSVVSAMESRLLAQLLERFELARYMAHVRGLDDHGASSKVELGRALQRELGIAPEELLFVGDTLHDLEVARAIGCRCLLYARGHQARTRLERAGAPLIDSLSGVLAHLAGSGAAP